MKFKGIKIPKPKVSPYEAGKDLLRAKHPRYYKRRMKQLRREVI